MCKEIQKHLIICCSINFINNQDNRPLFLLEPHPEHEPERGEDGGEYISLDLVYQKVEQMQNVEILDEDNPPGIYGIRLNGLEMDENGMWLGQRDKNSPAGGLFLLDDFQYLDPAETVKNPFYDNLSGQGARGGKHNFGFTMKIQAQFEYVPGQYFSFFGDDDVWVFINNKLVVDIGGQHAQEEGAVDLDTLGLTPGVTYPFHIFYAERHIYESNFKMLTSIDLQTEASLLLKDLSQDGVLRYDIWQIVREQQLSCDFSNTMQTKDTTRAPSNFNLLGGNLPAEGVYLDSAGTWYGGIIINNDMSGFQVNAEAIKRIKECCAKLH